MKASLENDMRCPFMAGEAPAKMNRLCTECEIARDPNAAGDMGKHLNCAFLERKKKRSGDTKKKLEPKRKAARKSSPRKQASRGTSAGAKKRRIKRYRDGYDGYYDDVLPQNDGGVRQGIDGELAKKIAILIGGVLLIVGICVAVMYYV